MPSFFRPVYILFIVTSVLMTSACSFFSIYRLPTQQGADISQSQLDALTSKMNKDAVANSLGSPLINDPLASNVWLYPFIRKESGKVVHQQVVKIYFNGDLFEKYEIDGDNLQEPSSKETY